MDRTFKLGSCIVSLVQSDISRQDTEAIVNAAHSGLLGDCFQRYAEAAREILT